MTEALTNTHLFGILLTLGLYYGCLWLRKRLKKNWINPLLISAFLIILVLIQINIPYEHYTKGANFIHAFLGPVTVVLALPLIPPAQVIGATQIFDIGRAYLVVLRHHLYRLLYFVACFI